MDHDIDTVVETLKRTFNPRRQIPLGPEAFFRRRQKPSEDPAVYLHELHQTARETFDYLSQVYLDKMGVRQFGRGLRSHTAEIEVLRFPDSSTDEALARALEAVYLEGQRCPVEPVVRSLNTSTHRPCVPYHPDRA